MGCFVIYVLPRWHLMSVLSVSKTQKDVDSIANDDVGYREDMEVLPETNKQIKHQRKCG